MVFSCLGCQYGKVKIPLRVVIVVTCFMAVTLLFAMRVCLNLLINEMIPLSKSNVTDGDHSDHCPVFDNTTTKPKDILGQIERQNWSETEQGFVRASFYIGYVPGHFPVGFFADVFGGKWVLITCILISSVFTILLPLLVSWTGHFAIVGGSRIMVGIGQSMMYPAVCSLTQRWILPEERGTLGSLTFTGSHIGTVFGNVISALLAAWVGWQMPFYVLGIMGIFWAFVVWLLVYTYPEEHPHISDEEKELLSHHIKSKAKLKVPWGSILTDKAIWGMILGEFAHTIVFFTFNTDLPKYLAQVLKFDIQNNGLLSSLPSIGMWISSTLSGKLADWMYKKRHIRIIHIRRWFTLFGNAVPAFICILAGYMGCNVWLAVTCFILSLTAKGPVYAGHKVNYLEITKNFSGVSMAFINGLGCISGIIEPYIVSLIVTEQKVSQWHIVFWISCVLSTVPTIIYMFITTDQRSKWDYVEDEERPA